MGDSRHIEVGLDIGNFSIKAAALNKAPLSRERILSFGIESIPKDATFEQKAELIRKSLEDAGITAKQVNISVSGPNVICRYIRLPFMPRHELSRALELDWDNFISLKIDEVIWDYAVLDTLRESTRRKYIQVVLVAAKKNFIEERLRLLKAVGLEAQSIDVDAFALFSAFKFTHPLENKHPVVLLNMGEYFTNVAVLRKGICWFTRDIPLGGRDITQIFMEKLHLTWTEAEKLKHSLNGQNPNALQLVKTILDNLVNELNLSFEYLKRELEEPINFICISGGSAHLFQLEEFLHEKLNIPVRKWNPTGAFKFHPALTPKALERHDPDLAVAVGLALSEKSRL